MGIHLLPDAHFVINTDEPGIGRTGSVTYPMLLSPALSGKEGHYVLVVGVLVVGVLVVGVLVVAAFAWVGVHRRTVALAVCGGHVVTRIGARLLG